MCNISIKIFGIFWEFFGGLQLLISLALFNRAYWSGHPFVRQPTPASSSLTRRKTDAKDLDAALGLPPSYRQPLLLPEAASSLDVDDDDVQGQPLRKRFHDGSSSSENILGRTLSAASTKGCTKSLTNGAWGPRFILYLFM